MVLLIKPNAIARNEADVVAMICEYFWVTSSSAGGKSKSYGRTNLQFNSSEGARLLCRRKNQ